MRIDRLELRNFKMFAALDLDLHRQSTDGHNPSAT